VHSDFHRLKHIYEAYNTGDQTQFPGVTQSYQGNYDQPMANGPGHAPVHVGGPPSTGDIIEMPRVENMTSKQLLSWVQRGVEREMERAKSKNMTYALNRFKAMYAALMKLEEHPQRDRK
jgi:hypothetical protein